MHRRKSTIYRINTVFNLPIYHILFGVTDYCSYPKLAGLVADRDDRARGAFHYAVVVRRHVLDVVRRGRVLDHHNGLARQIGISQLFAGYKHERNGGAERCEAQEVKRHEPKRNGTERNGTERNGTRTGGNHNSNMLMLRVHSTYVFR